MIVDITPIPIDYLICDDYNDFEMSEKSLLDIETGNYKPAYFDSLEYSELVHAQLKTCVQNAKDAREFQESKR
jgi:hypothetical protein